MEQSPKNTNIAIVGGGFCGTLTAIHLMQSANHALHIHLFNYGTKLNRGIAYDAYTDAHILNVRAQNMSAFSDSPLHFVDWLAKHPDYKQSSHEERMQTFAARNVYGQYLEHVFEEALQKKPEHIAVSLYAEQVTHVYPETSGYLVITAKGHVIHVNQVVLATGIDIPKAMQYPDLEHLPEPFYQRNPWTQKAVKDLHPHAPVLLLGSGLTMADTLIGLRLHNHTGLVYTLSPHGFETYPQRGLPPYPNIHDVLQKGTQLNQLIHTCHGLLEDKRITLDALIDAFRPHTQEIWRGFSISEKKQFLQHLRHHWEVARHRLPESIYAIVQTETKQQQLLSVAGRIVHAKIKEQQLSVRYLERNSQQVKNWTVQRIINCTGPNPDIKRSSNPLIKDLLQLGLAQPDPTHLGLLTDEHYGLIGINNQAHNNLYTIGCTLKGMLWESTAVPELRQQAAALANRILTVIKEQV